MIIISYTLLSSTEYGRRSMAWSELGQIYHTIENLYEQIH